MTTIAIVGGAIAARSLLFAMAKKKICQKVLLFHSDVFAFPCSIHSTAIVASRGISPGHSALGDTLYEAFSHFKAHVEADSPKGAIEVPQYTGASSKLEAFKKRYPNGGFTQLAGNLKLKEEIYLIQERAYLIRPREYLDWLLEEARRDLDIEIIPEFVTEINNGVLRTVDGTERKADKIIFAGGVMNSVWWSGAFEKKNTKSVQGSYLEFQEVPGESSFSLTIDGDNLIYDCQRQTLLVGSTTQESFLALAPEKDLHQIHERLSRKVDFPFPGVSEGIVRVGLREKASRREPYIFQNERGIFIGGYYKNGYSLGGLIAEKVLSEII